MISKEIGDSTHCRRKSLSSHILNLEDQENSDAAIWILDTRGYVVAILAACF